MVLVHKVVESHTTVPIILCAVNRLHNNLYHD